MDTAELVLSSSVGPSPPGHNEEIGFGQALTQMFYDIVFDIPDGDHPVEEKTSGAKLERDVVGIQIRNVPEQYFIAYGEQSSCHMRMVVQHYLSFSGNRLPRAPQPRILFL